MDTRLANAPKVIWFTGLSGSGKTTLAEALRESLHQTGITKTYHLDGDLLRKGINADLGFSMQDRDENLRRAAHIAQLFLDEGYWVLASFITPLNRHQAMVRSILPEDRFLEVYLSTSLEVCQQRDPKKLYAKTASGEVAEMTGVQSPYERPVNPALRINTAELSVGESISLLLNSLEHSW